MLSWNSNSSPQPWNSSALGGVHKYSSTPVSTLLRTRNTYCSPPPHPAQCNRSATETVGWPSLRKHACSYGTAERCPVLPPIRRSLRRRIDTLGGIERARGGFLILQGENMYTVKLVWEVTPWKGWIPAAREPIREPAGLPTTDPRWLSRDTGGRRLLKEDCRDNCWEATAGWPVRGWRQDGHGQGHALRHVPRPDNRLQQDPKNMSWTFSALLIIYIKEA